MQLVHDINEILGKLDNLLDEKKSIAENVAEKSDDIEECFDYLHKNMSKVDEKLIDIDKLTSIVYKMFGNIHPIFTEIYEIFGDIDTLYEHFNKQNDILAIMLSNIRQNADYVFKLLIGLNEATVSYDAKVSELEKKLIYIGKNLLDDDKRPQTIDAIGFAFVQKSERISELRIEMEEKRQNNYKAIMAYYNVTIDNIDTLLQD
jgi:uncharacterized protein YoxC